MISWDFNDKDCPFVNIAVLHIDEKYGTKIVADMLGSSYNKSGVVSLRQLIADFEAKRHGKKDEFDERYFEKIGELAKKKDEKEEENGNS